MNRYDELVNWLQEEHNEVFNQWAQIVAELDRKLEEANIEAYAKQLKHARERWEEKKALMQDFLDSEDSNELSEDLRKAIQFSLDTAGKEYNGSVIEPYHAWEGIRALMRGQRNNPIRRYGGI